MAEERKTVDAMLNEQKEQKSAKKNMCKNELQHGGKLQLLTPEKYKGYACHPAEDRTTRQVVNATMLKFVFTHILLRLDY